MHSLYVCFSIIAWFFVFIPLINFSLLTVWSNAIYAFIILFALCKLFLFSFSLSINVQSMFDVFSFAIYKQGCRLLSLEFDVKIPIEFRRLTRPYFIYSHSSLCTNYSIIKCKMNYSNQQYGKLDYSKSDDSGQCNVPGQWLFFVFIHNYKPF